MPPYTRVSLHTVLSLRSALRQSALGGEDDFPDVAPLPVAPRKSGREIMAGALTGSMRADAAARLQAGRNAWEGRDITATLAAATGNVAGQLAVMRAVAEKAARGPITQADRNAFDEAAASMAWSIRHTSHNGISLLDGTNWGDDSRLLVTGGTAGLDIHAGTAGRSITLYDFSRMTEGLPDSSALGDSATAGQLRDRLDGLLRTAESRASGYDAQSTTFSSSARVLEMQGHVAELTTKRALHGAREADGIEAAWSKGIRLGKKQAESPQMLRARRYLLPGSGRIVDESS